MKTELTQVGEKGTLPGLVFRATRDIAAGEELSVPYYHPDDFVSRNIFFRSPLNLRRMQSEMFQFSSVTVEHLSAWVLFSGTRS
jgi:SET domain-containing protein